MSSTVELPKTVQGKSGLLTTEFWSHLLVNVVGLLTMVGEIKPTGNPKYDSLISMAAGVATAANNIGYFRSRSQVKVANATASSEVTNLAQHLAAQTGQPSPVVVNDGADVQPSYVADDGGV